MLWGRFDNERSTLNMYNNPHFEPSSGLADTDAVVAEAGLEPGRRFDFFLNQKMQIKAKPCISSIPQELHIINTQCCISSSRRNIHAGA